MPDYVRGISVVCSPNFRYFQHCNPHECWISAAFRQVCEGIANPSTGNTVAGVRVPLPPPASLGYRRLSRQFPKNPGFPGPLPTFMSVETVFVCQQSRFAMAVSVWRFSGSVSLLTGKRTGILMFFRCSGQEAGLISALYQRLMRIFPNPLIRE